MSNPGFRSFSPALQRFFLATVVNMAGSGMIFAFIFVYLDNVRGFSGFRAGLAVGVTPLATVVSTPLAGYLSDRFGPRRILTLGCLLSIVAGGAYAYVTTFEVALIIGVLMGVANGLWFPSQSALISVIVTPELRPAASAFQRTALNLGAGVGGGIGGLIADTNRPGTFQVMFAINVATYLVFLTCLPGLPSGRLNKQPVQDDQGASGFGAVLRDRFYIRLLASDIGIALGFGFLWGVVPAYAKRIGIRESVIGSLFFIGAISVVVFQLPMLRWVRGRRRMRSLAVMNATFAVAAVLTGVAVDAPFWVAFALLAFGQAIAGFGESILGVIRQPLTADLAPPALVGRYYGLAAMVFQGCMGAANAIGGALMDVSLRGIWFFAAIMSVYGVVTSLMLERRIPAHLRLAP